MGHRQNCQWDRGWSVEGSWRLTGQLNSLIWPNTARFAAQPWGCSASTSCEIFTACCRMFLSNHWTRLPPHSGLSKHNISTKPYGRFSGGSISRWSEDGALTNSGGGEGDAGGSCWPYIWSLACECDFACECMLPTLAVEYDLPFPLLLLTNHGWVFGEVGERDAVQGQHFWGGGGGLGDGTGWGGQGRDLCLSARESRPRCQSAVNTAVYPSMYIHSLTHTWKQTTHTHTEKTHTHAFNTGCLNCHCTTVCAHSLWHLYSKNTLIIPIIHPCTCFWAHRDTQRCLLSISSESMWSAEDLLAGHTILLVLVCCWFWDLPLSVHHRRGPCGLTCQVTSLPLNTLSGTPVPWKVRDELMSQCNDERERLFLFTIYCWHQSGSTANCQVFRI